MIDFFLTSGNSPFSIALALMLILAVLELISASFGMGLSEMIDSILPEMDVDIDADLDVAEPGGGADSMVRLLSWFRIGEVPVLILFVVFLTGFGLSGLIIQFTALQIAGRTIPALIAVVPAIMCALPTVRVLGGFMGRHMPKDETYVVSEKSFIGQVATITMGTAKQDKPAPAKLRDKHGQTHYILVVPDNPEESFEIGVKTIIVSQNGSIFKVIANTSSSMID